MAYFLIVSRQDVPLYEAELSSTAKARQLEGPPAARSSQLPGGFTC